MNQRTPIFVVALAFAAVGCVASAHDADTSRGRRSLGRPVATLDTARARQLCVAPDSVLTGRAACVLRDQRRVVKVF